MSDWAQQLIAEEKERQRRGQAAEDRPEELGEALLMMKRDMERGTPIPERAGLGEMALPPSPAFDLSASRFGGRETAVALPSTLSVDTGPGVVPEPKELPPGFGPLSKRIGVPPEQFRKMLEKEIGKSPTLMRALTEGAYEPVRQLGAGLKQRVKETPTVAALVKAGLPTLVGKPATRLSPDQAKTARKLINQEALISPERAKYLRELAEAYPKAFKAGQITGSVATFLAEAKLLLMAGVPPTGIFAMVGTLERTVRGEPTTLLDVGGELAAGYALQGIPKVLAQRGTRPVLTHLAAVGSPVAVLTGLQAGRSLAEGKSGEEIWKDALQTAVVVGIVSAVLHSRPSILKKQGYLETRHQLAKKIGQYTKGTSFERQVNPEVMADQYIAAQVATKGGLGKISLSNWIKAAHRIQQAEIPPIVQAARPAPAGAITPAAKAVVPAAKPIVKPAPKPVVKPEVVVPPVPKPEVVAPAAKLAPKPAVKKGARKPKPAWEKALKEQEAYLLAEVDKALGKAKDVPTGTGTVTFKVPGNGTFTVGNSKEALEKFRQAAKGLWRPYSEFTVTERPDFDKSVDDAIRLYGDAEAAANKIEAQAAQRADEATKPQKRSYEKIVYELRRRANLTSKPADQMSDRIVAVEDAVDQQAYEVEQSRVRQEQETRRTAAIAAMKKHPQYAELRDALVAKVDRTDIPKNGDLLNVDVSGRGAPAIRIIQDKIAGSLGLNREKPDRGLRYQAWKPDFDLTRYWHDLAEPEAKPVEAAAKPAVVEARKLPINPITLIRKPRQSIEPDGAWEVQVVGDRDDLTSARLREFQESAGSGIDPSVEWAGDLGNVIFRYDTKTAAEGAIVRLAKHPDLVKPAAAPEKQPWEMTVGEFGQITEFPTGGRFNISGEAQRIRVEREGQSKYFGSAYAAQTWISREHKKIIRQALSEGKPIPPEVLADYPDLAKKAPIVQKPEISAKRIREKVAEKEVKPAVTPEGELVAPTEAPSDLITRKQQAYIHILKEEKALTDRQYRSLLKTFTGKRTAAAKTPPKQPAMTKQEAAKAITAIGKVLPKELGEGVVLPRKKAMVPAGFFDKLTPQQVEAGVRPSPKKGKPAGVMGWVTPTIRYMKKVGAYEQVYRPMKRAFWKRMSENKSLKSLEKGVFKGIKNDSPKDIAMFEYLEKRLTPESREVLTSDDIAQAERISEQFREFLARINKTRVSLHKKPITPRQNYAPHIFDAVAEQTMKERFPLSNESLAALHDFVISTKTTGRFLQRRLGAENYRKSLAAAWRAYKNMALDIIHFAPPTYLAKSYIKYYPPSTQRYLRAFLKRGMFRQAGDIEKEIEVSTKWLDKIAEEAPIIPPARNTSSAVLSTGKALMHIGGIGLNYTTVIKNMTQSVLTHNLVDTADTGQAMTLLSGNMGKFIKIANTNPMALGRFPFEIKKVDLMKVLRFTMIPYRMVDAFNISFAYSAGLAHELRPLAKTRGVSVDKLMDEYIERYAGNMNQVLRDMETGEGFGQQIEDAITLTGEMSQWSYYKQDMPRIFWQEPSASLAIFQSWPLYKTLHHYPELFNRLFTGKDFKGRPISKEQRMGLFKDLILMSLIATGLSKLGIDIWRTVGPGVVTIPFINSPYVKLLQGASQILSGAFVEDEKTRKWLMNKGLRDVVSIMWLFVPAGVAIRREIKRSKRKSRR